MKLFYFYFYFVLPTDDFHEMTEETDSNPDRYRESDRSSNLSDVKADIRAGSSVSNAESVTALDSEGEGSTRGVNALALAGPVPNPLGYRYSADYTEPSFPPKNNVSTRSKPTAVIFFFFPFIYFFFVHVAYTCYEYYQEDIDKNKSEFIVCWIDNKYNKFIKNT